jgi:hypothetical protein
MAVKKTNTARKYESQFTAAVEQGFMGTYGEFAKIQSSPAQKKATTGRKYETEFAAAVAAGYTGKYADYVRTLNSSQPIKRRIEELPPREAAALKGSDGAPTVELEALSANVERIAERVSESLDILQNWNQTSGCQMDPNDPAPLGSEVEEQPETPRQQEERLREERRVQMNHRYGRHKIIDNVTMVVMRGYVPNFSQLPSGYILAVHREQGTVHPFYFRLYSDAQLNPQSPHYNMGRNGPGMFRGDSMRNDSWDNSYARSSHEMHRTEGRDGWNELHGLENYGASVPYLHQRISEVACSLFNDDVFFCQDVFVAPTIVSCEQPLRLMGSKGQYSSKDQDMFSIDGLMTVTLEEAGSLNSGYESNVRVYFPGAEKDEWRQYRMLLTVPFPAQFVATECSAHWLAREIARRLAYTHPDQVGRGVVVLELGGEFTKHEPRIAEVVL